MRFLRNVMSIQWIDLSGDDLSKQVFQDIKRL